MGIYVEYPADVLAPREETELIGRSAVNLLSERPGIHRVIDMCCGSGNLACAVATALDSATICACDMTSSCVSAAWRNVDRLGLSGRVQVRQGDLFGALPIEEFDRSVDVVMCPPLHSDLPS